jgi:hypothetical protein
VRPEVLEKERPKILRKKTKEKDSVTLPVVPKYKESSIDDDDVPAAPVGRKKSSKKSMLLVSEERRSSDVIEKTDSTESVTRTVKLKKKRRTSRKSLMASVSIEKVEATTKTSSPKMKRKSDPKISSEKLKSSPRILRKEEIIHHILEAKTAEKKAGVMSNRGESNSVRAPLPKVKPPPKVFYLH